MAPGCPSRATDGVTPSSPPPAGESIDSLPTIWPTPLTSCVGSATDSQRRRGDAASASQRRHTVFGAPRVRLTRSLVASDNWGAGRFRSSSLNGTTRGFPWPSGVVDAVDPQGPRRRTPFVTTLRPYERSDAVRACLWRTHLTNSWRANRGVCIAIGGMEPPQRPVPSTTKGNRTPMTDPCRRARHSRDGISRRRRGCQPRSPPPNAQDRPAAPAGQPSAGPEPPPQLRRVVPPPWVPHGSRWPCVRCSHRVG